MANNEDPLSIVAVVRKPAADRLDISPGVNAVLDIVVDVGTAFSAVRYFAEYALAIERSYKKWEESSFTLYIGTQASVRIDQPFPFLYRSDTISYRGNAHTAIGDGDFSKNAGLGKLSNFTFCLCGR